ncbi:hypothetical protein QUA62_26650 [Microcoleus sp. MON1_C1]|uniref:hypothetical protein n=1 Tax=Microcoleus sp. MON1_C1 TaxID=2818827 RepID=UPI002FD4762C
MLQSSNHDSESDSTTEEISLGASSVVGETSRTITVTNTSDSGPGSLRNAVVPSQDEPNEYFNGSNGILTVAANTFSETGEKQDIPIGDYAEANLYAAINTGNGNDTGSEVGNDILIGDYSEVNSSTIIDTGNGNDSLIGAYSELHPISEIIILPPPKPSFQFNGFPGLSIAIQRSQEVELEFSGANSSNGAWALGSTFELSSGVPFFSQTGTSAGIYMPVGAEHVDTWGNSDG